MSLEQNKEIARRFIEEAWNEGRLATIDQVMSPAVANHDWPPGQTSTFDQLKQFIAGYRAKYPNHTFTIEDMVGEGDEAATRVTIRGVDGSGPGSASFACRTAKLWSNGPIPPVSHSCKQGKKGSPWLTVARCWSAASSKR